MSHLHIIIWTLVLMFLNSGMNSENFSIVDDFVGKEWIGHYLNSEDSLLTHNIKWEHDLDKHVLIQTKNVPVLGFVSKTYYYFDNENDEINYITLMNKDIVSKGNVQIDLNQIILNGTSFFSKGMQKNKQTFELENRNKLRDTFYFFKEGEWKLGHTIQYKMRKE